MNISIPNDDESKYQFAFDLIFGEKEFLRENQCIGLLLLKKQLKYFELQIMIRHLNT